MYSRAVEEVDAQILCFHLVSVRKVSQISEVIGLRSSIHILILADLRVCADVRSIVFAHVAIRWCIHATDHSQVVSHCRLDQPRKVDFEGSHLRFVPAITWTQMSSHPLCDSLFSSTSSFRMVRTKHLDFTVDLL
jgi:hypothetical protein